MIVEAKDFAKELNDGKHHFGCASRERIIDGLLKIVAAVADGRMLVQAIHVRSEMAVDDYTMYEFVMRYAEAKEPLPTEMRVPEDQLRKLYGSHHFPVEIRST
jgi:sulfur transfer protein SufE